jgi:hypothetical protein
MTVRNTPAASSNSGRAIHAGLNARVVSHTFAGTISASSRVNMFPLPGGARVVGGNLTVTGGSPGAGALASVQDGQGNLYIRSTSAGTVANFSFDPTHASHGARLTGSANVFVQLNGFSGATGTASMQVTLSLQYLSDEDGD